jgi:Mn2+/Fe2+ NRAMP family transporter
LGVVLYVAQEMVSHLGAFTGVGHGKMLQARFGRFWAAFSVLDFFLLNFLTLLTEFIGFIGRVAHGLVVPGIEGGLSTTAMIFIIGIVGTTVAPWQLFFQQGSVVDKQISTRFTNYERADTPTGSIFTDLGAAFAIVLLNGP